MGCPSEVEVGDNLVFSICTYNLATGVLTDADTVPTYRLYEDETATPILTGSMAKLDDAGTTGFYTELIACTVANGFESGKTYTVYIAFVVSGSTGGISYAFKAKSTLSEVADAVWDETLSSGSHANLFSAGKRLQNVVLRGGTAIAGGANYVQLPGPWGSTDGLYEENIISIVDGTGAGQTRLVTEYVGSTRRAYVDRDWHIVPDATSEIELLPFSGILLSQHGLAAAGTASSITLSADASAVDGTYVGSVIYIASGTGTGQIRLITAYAGGTKVATVSDDWTTTPDATSVYKVLPVGRVIVDSLGTTALADVQAEAEDALEAFDLDHLIQVSAGSEEPTVGAYLDQIMNKDASQTFDAATDSLEAIQESQVTLGAGAITFTYTLTDSSTGLPIADADVWVTTDVGGANVVANGTTNSSGQVTFYLDAGTYYVWRQKDGWNFSNPDVEVVA